MNGKPKRLVEQLEAAKASLRALQEALERTQKMIEQTRKIIEEAKELSNPDESPQAHPPD
jgi:chromosome segregation ATPase